MSLMERVRDAGNAHVADTAASPLVPELRRRVQEILPAHRIAQMRAENPRQAENEVRLAAARVFEEDPWLVEGQAERQRAVTALIDSLFGFGPLEWMLGDESITEIMVNGTQSLFVERGGVLERVHMAFTDEDAVRALIDRILGPLGRRIDEASPMVNARLPQGHRVNAVIPPLSPDGPMLTIRKFRQTMLTLQEMCETGSVEDDVRRVLVWAVRARKNMAVSGGTGSGKTTLLNALSCEISEAERIITIEDSLELRFTEHPHVVRLEARPPSMEGTGEVTIRDLVTNSLRMRPDRIIVGECRGAEALDMLQAMNTGHDGSLTTLHANNPTDAIMRLSTMVRFAADLPVDVIEAQIAAAFDVIVQVVRDACGRRFINEVCEVRVQASRALEVIQLYQREQFDMPGVWVQPPAWLNPLQCGGWAQPEEVGAWLHRHCML